MDTIEKIIRQAWAALDKDLKYHHPGEELRKVHWDRGHIVISGTLQSICCTPVAKEVRAKIMNLDYIPREILNQSVFIELSAHELAMLHIEEHEKKRRS